MNLATQITIFDEAMTSCIVFRETIQHSYLQKYCNLEAKQKLAYDLCGVKSFQRYNSVAYTDPHGNLNPSRQHKGTKTVYIKNMV